MFDFAWSQIALIGVVALVAIGPKDLPVAIKAVAEMVKRARRMAGEFQGHLDEMMRDTSLHEVRDQINQIRNFDLRGEVQRAVDPDGSLRSTLAEDPFHPTTPPAIAPFDEVSIAPHPAPPPDWRAAMVADDAPAFIPPEIAHPEQPPEFLPPGTRRR